MGSHILQHSTDVSYSWSISWHSYLTWLKAELLCACCYYCAIKFFIFCLTSLQPQSLSIGSDCDKYKSNCWINNTWHMWANECNTVHSALLTIMKPYNFTGSWEVMCRYGWSIGKYYTQILLPSMSFQLMKEKNDRKECLWARWYVFLLFICCIKCLVGNDIEQYFSNCGPKPEACHHWKCIRFSNMRYVSWHSKICSTLV